MLPFNAGGIDKSGILDRRAVVDHELVGMDQKRSGNSDDKGEIDKEAFSIVDCVDKSSRVTGRGSGNRERKIMGVVKGKNKSMERK